MYRDGGTEQHDKPYDVCYEQEYYRIKGGYRGGTQMNDVLAGSKEHGTVRRNKSRWQ